MPGPWTRCRAIRYSQVPLVKTTAWMPVERNWQLGLGPCGEVVKELRMQFTLEYLVIEQSTDKSLKSFFIPKGEIMGTVSVTHWE